MSRPKGPVENVDYYCGTCVGRRVIACAYCFGGCPECGDTGEEVCPQCKGGEIPVPPPDWL